MASENLDQKYTEWHKVLRKYEALMGKALSNLEQPHLAVPTASGDFSSLDRFRTTRKELHKEFDWEELVKRYLEGVQETDPHSKITVGDSILLLKQIFFLMRIERAFILRRTVRLGFMRAAALEATGAGSEELGQIANDEQAVKDAMEATKAKETEIWSARSSASKSFKARNKSAARRSVQTARSAMAARNGVRSTPTSGPSPSGFGSSAAATPGSPLNDIGSSSSLPTVSFNESFNSSGYTPAPYTPNAASSSPAQKQTTESQLSGVYGDVSDETASSDPTVIETDGDTNINISVNVSGTGGGIEVYACSDTLFVYHRLTCTLARPEMERRTLVEIAREGRLLPCTLCDPRDWR